MCGLIVSAAFTAAGATMATGADTRETNSPIWGMPLAVLDGAMTGTLARLAMGSAANACCDRLGPKMPTTLATLIRFWKALMAVASSLPASWKTSLIGRPLTPPRLLKYSSAIWAPRTCSWPARATLPVWATATPMGIGWAWDHAEAAMAASARVRASAKTDLDNEERIARVPPGKGCRLAARPVGPATADYFNTFRGCPHGHHMAERSKSPFPAFQGPAASARADRGSSF